MKLQNYKELIVWQKSINLVFEVYNITKKLPTDEKFGLCTQSQRAVVAIPSNIAEGAARNNTKEFIHFLGIAYGSSAELETQLIIIKQLFSNIDCSKAELLLEEIQKMINGLINKLRSTVQ